MRFRAAFVLAGLLAAAPAAAGDAVLHTGSIGQAVWTADRPTSGIAAARAASFAIAMLHYRHHALAEWKAGPYPLLDGSGAAAGHGFVWLARDGSHVEKVRQGLFRLTIPEAASGLFRSVDCHAGEWPSFTCSDGRTRAMSVPSNARLVFGRVTYERLEPAGR